MVRLGGGGARGGGGGRTGGGERRPQVRLAAQQGYREVDEAVEVHQAAGAELGQQFRLDDRVGGGLGQQPLTGRGRTGQLGGHRERGGLVGDLEVRAKAGEFVVLPEYLQAEAVKSGHGEPSG